jgi:hypothetical protein
VTTRADWSRATRLTVVQFLACWEALGLGDTPLALNLRPVGRTREEHRRMHGAALAELAARGLADPVTHAPGAGPAGTLRLLAGAALLADLRLTGDRVAVGAMHRESGAVVLLGGGALRLLDVPGPLVPAALVDLVGPLRPAAARQVNIPAEALDQACRTAPDGDPWALADRLAELGVPPADGHSLALMCAGMSAAGQLGVTARETTDAGTRERRGRWVVGFHRARAGDCLQLRRPCGPPHREPGGTVTVGPVSARTLLAQVTELLRDTAGQIAYDHPVSA